MQNATAIQARDPVTPAQPQVRQQEIELVGQKRCDQHHDDPRSGQPAKPDGGREQGGQADAVERPQLSRVLVDGRLDVVVERENVHDSERPFAARVVVRQVDVAVEGDALCHEEVMRLVARRDRVHRVVHDQVSRKRDDERSEPADDAPERRAVANRLYACSRARS